MVNIKLTRQQAEELLEIYEQEGSDQEIIEELKISLGIIKPKISAIEAQVISQMQKVFADAVVRNVP